MTKRLVLITVDDEKLFFSQLQDEELRDWFLEFIYYLHNRAFICLRGEVELPYRQSANVPSAPRFLITPYPSIYYRCLVCDQPCFIPCSHDICFINR